MRDSTLCYNQRTEDSENRIKELKLDFGGDTLAFVRYRGESDQNRAAVIAKYQGKTPNTVGASATCAEEV